MNNKTQTAGKPLRKAVLKSVIALVLCMATIIGSIGAGAGTASAAKKYNLTLKFNGKSVTIAKDVYNKCTVTTFEKLKKSLGNPKKKTNKKEGTTYTWKKGKTFIEYYPDGMGGAGVLYINIEDKNGSTFGVKVGMKKSTAIKKLKENLDPKKIDTEMGNAHLGFGFGSGGSIVMFENGKVSSIGYYFINVPKK